MCGVFFPLLLGCFHCFGNLASGLSLRLFAYACHFLFGSSGFMFSADVGGWGLLFPLFAFWELFSIRLCFAVFSVASFTYLASFVCFLRLLLALLCRVVFHGFCRYHSGCVALAACSLSFSRFHHFLQLSSSSLVSSLFRVFSSLVMLRYGLLFVTFLYYSLRLFSRWSSHMALPGLLRLVALCCSVAFSFLRFLFAVFRFPCVCSGVPVTPFCYSIIISRSSLSKVSS